MSQKHKDILQAKLNQSHYIGTCILDLHRLFRHTKKIKNSSEQELLDDIFKSIDLLSIDQMNVNGKIRELRYRGWNI
jgi:hypothetical protein